MCCVDLNPLKINSFQQLSVTEECCDIRKAEERGQQRPMAETETKASSSGGYRGREAEVRTENHRSSSQGNMPDHVSLSGTAGPRGSEQASPFWNGAGHREGPKAQGWPSACRQGVRETSRWERRHKPHWPSTTGRVVENSSLPHWWNRCFSQSASLDRGQFKSGGELVFRA